MNEKPYPGDLCPQCQRITPHGRFCEHCGALLDEPKSPPLPEKVTTKSSPASSILPVIGALFLFFIITAVVFAFVFGIAANVEKNSGITPATVVPTMTGASPAGGSKDATIIVSSDVAGAQIAIDGTYTGMTSVAGPTTIAVTSGSHTVSVSKDGYTPFYSTVTSAGGKSSTVYATLSYNRIPTQADTPRIIVTKPVYSPSVTYNQQYSQSWHPGATSTIQVSGASYYYFNLKLKAGDWEKISLVTDGAPVDLMIMDSSNFNIYKNSFTSKSSWNSWNRLSIIKDEYPFVAPGDDTYYFVLDNTNSPMNGANSGRNVNVAVTFSSYY